MMRFRDILQTANSNLRRSKVRTFLTVIAIFIGALTLTLTNGIGSGIQTYIDEQVGNIGAKDMLIIQGKSENPFSNSDGPQKYDPDVNTTTAGGFPMVVLDEKDLEKVKSQPGILSAEFDLNIAPDYISGSNGEKFKLTAGSFYDGINVTLAAGSAPSNKAPEHQILLPLNFPNALGFASSEDAVGKMVKIGVKTPTNEQREVEATIIGVQQQTLLSAGGAMVNRSLLQAIYDIQAEGLPAEIRSKQPVITARFDVNDSEEEVKAIKDSLDKAGYTAITIQDQIGIFKQVISAIITVLNFFAAITLLAASFGIVNTLLMSVQERTKEIGLMKAMGMSGRKIFLLFSIEATLIGFWGSLLGSLAGIGLGALANRIASNTFLKDLVGFKLTSFPLTSVIVIMLIIMAIAFLAGTLPARRASKKDPIDALRYE